MKMERSNKDYIFECENGTVYGIPYDTKCCLICKHCTDIWYDYTNGPYMFSCELNEDTRECINCNSFELQEDTLTVEEYEKKINSKEYKEQQKQIEEIIKKVNEFMIENNELVLTTFIKNMAIPISTKKGLFKSLLKNKKGVERK